MTGIVLWPFEYYLFLPDFGNYPRVFYASFSFICAGRLLNVSCMFNLRSVSTGEVPERVAKHRKQMQMHRQKKKMQSE